MATSITSLTLKKAALISGFGYILMFGTGIAEFTVMGKLVNMNNAELTVKNIMSNLPLFRHGIMLYTVNFIGDILAALGIYYLLKPVNGFLSLLAASLRIIFTLLSLAALLNLITVVQLVQPQEYLKSIPAEQLQAQVMMALQSFRSGWMFCYIFFGLYLVLIGWLAVVSKYIHFLIGICLIIAGLGWLADSVSPYMLPGASINIGMTTGVLELVFMFWLFIKGSRLKEPV